ncbi:HAD family phosphatase [uncultured Mailhella sp.]|uniref:HAD family hydrolase n=1 Tax=uncultured Mailhella sp. TaxID=1981031 RepID=UPI0025E47FBC|nr:HAD family phosphatase [uncultured Mailhella sp.]
MPCIVFDMDGVLIDSERLVLRSWECVGKDMGLSGLHDLFFRCIGTTHASTRIIFSQVFGDAVDYEKFRDCTRVYYMKFTKDGIPLKPGVMELLSWLREKGWKTGLASSSREANVRRNMEITGMGPYFDTLVCGDMLTASKPAPDIYLRACAELHARAEDSYAVEDSRNGILSASAAGMKALLVPDMVAPDETMLRSAHAVFPDLCAVRRWLAREEYQEEA